MMRWLAAGMCALVCWAAPNTIRGQTAAIEDSLRKLTQSPIDTVRVKGYMRLAFEVRKTSLDSAYNFLELARTSLDSVAHPVLYGNYLNVLAILHGEEGHYALVDYYSQQAESIYAAQEYPSRVAMMRSNRAIDYVEQARYTEAIELNLEALAYAQEIEDLEDITRLHNNLGYVYQRIGDYVQALAHLNEALQLAHENGYAEYVGLGNYNLGNVYRSLGRYEDAEQHYKTAIPILDSLGLPAFSALAWRDLGANYVELGNLVEASACIERSIQLFKDIGTLPELAASEIELGRLLLKRGMPQAAHNQLRRAQALALQSGQPHLVADVWLLLAETELALGEPAMARQSLRTASAVIDSIHLRPALATRYRLEAEVAAAEGHTDAAYDWQKRYIALKDSLANEKLQEQVSQLQASHSLLIKDAEIKRLAQQNEIDLLRVRNFWGLGVLAILLLGGGGIWWQQRRNTRRLEAQLMTLSTAAPVPIGIIRKKNETFLFVSDQLAFLMHATPAEMEDASAHKYLGGEAVFRKLTSTWHGKGTHPAQQEIEFVSPYGEQLWLIVVAESAQFAGEDVWVVGLLNITERRAMEAELRAAKDTAESAYAELQLTRSKLVLREKLSALGELVASIAHELNSPLSVVGSSGQLLGDLLPRLIQTVARLEREMPTATQSARDELYKRLETPVFFSDTRAERQQRKELVHKLREVGLESPEEVARMLVDAGFVHLYDDLLEMLRGPHRAEVLELIYAFGQSFANINNINLASKKTHALVKALKRYTHTQPEDAGEVPVRLKDNLNTILLLYAHTIRQKVSLEVSLDSDTDVLADPDKLGQIWTNLISNALHAMEEGGILKIDLLEEGPNAVVRIADNGSGIPPDIVARIFDPFFTTKPKGEGTGMGLHIARQILESYGGGIAVTSEPGNTVFTITLPMLVRQPAEAAGAERPGAS